eukprot:scaffold78788_cov21-Tisochrysis_lutea.AAC.3
MQCLGQQQDLPAAEHAMLMHACMHGLVLTMQAAPAIHCLLPSGNQQQTTPKASSSTHQGRGVGHALQLTPVPSPL